MQAQQHLDGSQESPLAQESDLSCQRAALSDLPAASSAAGAHAMPHNATPTATDAGAAAMAVWRDATDQLREKEELSHPIGDAAVTSQGGAQVCLASGVCQAFTGNRDFLGRLCWVCISSV